MGILSVLINALNVKMPIFNFMHCSILKVVYQYFSQEKLEIWGLQPPMIAQFYSSNSSFVPKNRPNATPILSGKQGVNSYQLSAVRFQ